MFIPPAAFPSCRVSELLAACDGVLPSIPPAAALIPSCPCPPPLAARRIVPEGKG